MVLTLAEAAGVEPAHAMRGDLANRCHTIRRRLHRLAEGTGLEPASDKCAVVFKTTALPVRLPFQEILICEFEIRMAGTPGFEPRISGFESDGLPLSLRPNKSLVHVVGLAPTKDNQVRLILQSGAFAAQPHMQMEISDLKFQIPDFKFKSQRISNPRSICA